MPEDPGRSRRDEVYIRERPQDYWDFRDTLWQALEVAGLLVDWRDRVAAGESLPQALVLALLDEIIEGRREHACGTATRVWGPGDTYQVCRGCGGQVMPVWMGGQTYEPGVCSGVRDIDFAVRTALGMPMLRHSPPPSPAG